VTDDQARATVVATIRHRTLSVEIRQTIAWLVFCAAVPLGLFDYLDGRQLGVAVIFSALLAVSTVQAKR
jgi:hypothetical protein